MIVVQEDDDLEPGSPTKDPSSDAKRTRLPSTAAGPASLPATRFGATSAFYYRPTSNREEVEIVEPPSEDPRSEFTAEWLEAKVDKRKAGSPNKDPPDAKRTLLRSSAAGPATRSSLGPPRFSGIGTSPARSYLSSSQPGPSRPTTYQSSESCCL
jgi:hypothetical protein